MRYRRSGSECLQHGLKNANHGSEFVTGDKKKGPPALSYAGEPYFRVRKGLLVVHSDREQARIGARSLCAANAQYAANCKSVRAV